MNIPYARLLQVIEQVAEGEIEERRRLAWLAWQIRAPFLTKQQGFDDYLIALGLRDKSPQFGEVVTRDEALAVAKDILTKFKA